MDRLIEYQKEVTIENAKRIFKNVSVVEAQTGDYCYLADNGKYVYEPYYNEVRFVFPNKKYIILLSKGYQAKIIEYAEEIETPKHYDNTKGTLYKVATERGWNSYLFDIVKRLERAEKKGEFKQDLEKSINVIKLWLNESKI